MYEKQIVARDEGQRLDKYLCKILPNAGLSFLYKMLRKKNITLNKKKATGSEKLSSGDRIQIFFSEDTLEKFMGHIPEEKMDKDGQESCKKEKLGCQDSGVCPSKAYRRNEVEIVYEDDHFLFLNKPVGMLSQKAEPQDYSLNEWILDYLFDSGQIRKEDLHSFRPGICNRLDRNTSGLVLAAKSIKGAQFLSAQLANRTGEKYYLTIVKGCLRDPMLLKGFLQKDEKHNKVTITPVSDGKEGETASCIETAYEPLCVTQAYTLLKVHLITGKSHQIRAHLAGIGHPIIGDIKYGGAATEEKLLGKQPLKHQLLHAYQITFPKAEKENDGGPEPSVMGKTFYAEPPAEFHGIMEALGYHL